MKKFFSEKWYTVSVTAIAIMLLVNLLFMVRNNYIIKRNNELKAEIDRVKANTTQIISNIVHGIDLGVRGFALTKTEPLLDPFKNVKKASPGLFTSLETMLRKQGFPHMDRYQAIRKEVDGYFEWSEQMIEMVRQDRMDEFNIMLGKDRGLDVWNKFTAFQQPMEEFENALYKNAEDEYEAAMRTNLVLQITTAFLALPVLFLIAWRIRKERAARQLLLAQVEENDRKFVFNPGITKVLTAQEIISHTIENTRKASNFVKNMANSNYDVEWAGLDQHNILLNENTLAGDLINMREKLKKVKQEDERRNWMNEGLATFSELVRNNQNDSQLLADKCVSFLTKYLNGQQASLFVHKDDEGDQYLELVSCYAFSKKKFIEKRIEIGNGLVGQVYLEGETVQLKEVPRGYTEITSGLGDATPAYLVIVPLKYDIHTVAILELASFAPFEQHQIQFLQKGGEFLASAILNTHNTQKMKNLLEHARMNEEQMKQREEEMRQNMEELQATQEELVRKEKELQKRLADSRVSSNF
jgi:CHASE3 domain sensor protein/putative methionine-R-sulfoxide reductase with GAF domain